MYFWNLSVFIILSLSLAAFLFECPEITHPVLTIQGQDAHRIVEQRFLDFAPHTDTQTSPMLAFMWSFQEHSFFFLLLLYSSIIFCLSSYRCVNVCSLIYPVNHGPLLFGVTLTRRLFFFVSTKEQTTRQLHLWSETKKTYVWQYGESVSCSDVCRRFVW